jgi:hypothetical protein
MIARVCAERAVFAPFALRAFTLTRSVERRSFFVAR